MRRKIWLSQKCHLGRDDERDPPAYAWRMFISRKYNLCFNFCSFWLPACEMVDANQQRLKGIAICKCTLKAYAVIMVYFLIGCATKNANPKLQDCLPLLKPSSGMSIMHTCLLLRNSFCDCGIVALFLLQYCYGMCSRQHLWTWRELHVQWTLYYWVAKCGVTRSFIGFS